MAARPIVSMWCASVRRGGAIAATLPASIELQVRETHGHPITIPTNT